MRAGIGVAHFRESNQDEEDCHAVPVVILFNGSGSTDVRVCLRHHPLIE